jgi:hypothetical protein
VNPRHLAAALCCLLVASAVLSLLAASGDRPSEARAAGPPAPPSREADALAVLRGWDARRAEAWAAGDPAALRPLYVARSVAGRRDRAALTAYAGLGLRVTGLRMQVLAAELCSWDADGFTLEVTDRVQHAVAVGRSARTLLPVDRPSTWLLSFVEVAGDWRLAQARPAASTASTSRSVNR